MKYLPTAPAKKEETNLDALIRSYSKFKALSLQVHLEPVESHAVSQNSEVMKAERTISQQKTSSILSAHNTAANWFGLNWVDVTPSGPPPSRDH